MLTRNGLTSRRPPRGPLVRVYLPVSAAGKRLEGDEGDAKLRQASTPHWSGAGGEQRVLHLVGREWDAALRQGGAHA
jgi:hypothetical protein